MKAKAAQEVHTALPTQAISKELSTWYLLLILRKMKSGLKKEKKTKENRSKTQLLQVLQMVWADFNGTRGKYSGTVNFEFFPHGNGTMAYDNGMEIKGEWAKGEWIRQSHPNVFKDVKPEKGEGQIHEENGWKDRRREFVVVVVS